MHFPVSLAKMSVTFILYFLRIIDCHHLPSSGIQDLWVSFPYTEWRIVYLDEATAPDGAWKGSWEGENWDIPIPDVPLLCICSFCSLCSKYLSLLLLCVLHDHLSF